MLRLSRLAAALAPLLLAACSGSAVVEPIEQDHKRARHFLEKCTVPAPTSGEAVVRDLEEIYVCLPPEDVCGEADDPTVGAALAPLIEKRDGCGETVRLLDVACGPDLNAVQCCYAVWIEHLDGC